MARTYYVYCVQFATRQFENTSLTALNAAWLRTGTPSGHRDGFGKFRPMIVSPRRLVFEHLNRDDSIPLSSMELVTLQLIIVTVSRTCSLVR
jgi:hypothetical protein